MLPCVSPLRPAPALPSFCPALWLTPLLRAGGTPTLPRVHRAPSTTLSLGLPSHVHTTRPPSPPFFVCFTAAAVLAGSTRLTRPPFSACPPPPSPFAPLSLPCSLGRILGHSHLLPTLPTRGIQLLRQYTVLLLFRKGRTIQICTSASEPPSPSLRPFSACTLARGRYRGATRRAAAPSTSPDTRLWPFSCIPTTYLSLPLSPVRVSLRVLFLLQLIISSRPHPPLPHGAPRA